MITAIARDDEPPALKILETFCSNSTKIILLKSYTKPGEALRYLEKFPVDLIFLDIQMPSLSGIAFHKFLKPEVMVIFTTAFSEFAIDGVNLNAIDYLLKPFTPERFHQAIEKAVDYKHYLIQNDFEKKYIFIRADYSLIKLNLADIQYIESLDDYLKIFSQNQKTIVARMTMKMILDKLTSTNFVRVHRSYIVSVNHIDKVRNKLIYIGEKEIPVGMSYEGNFNKIFKN